MNFLNNFQRSKKLLLINKLDFKKCYKNDLIHKIGDTSDKIFMMINGTITREMPVTIEKANKWPTGLHTWKMYKKSTTYSVKTPLEEGEIFGISEFIQQKPRTEKILAEDDSLVLSCSSKAFYEIFETYDVFQFVKKAEEDDKKKAAKLRDIFETQQKLQKIKEDALYSVAHRSSANRTPAKLSQMAKIQEWRRAEDLLVHPKPKETRILGKNVVKKELTSVYGT
jgi:signal-transduction protein with cAMP-binding, CBS, and nucleotidyltransferase domain